MSLEEFHNLSEETKRVIIFEADKVAEIKTDFDKFELFYKDDFFIEVKTNRSKNFRRSIKTYRQNEIPSYYSDTYYQLLKVG